MNVTIRRGGVADARAASELWLAARKAALGAIPAPVHDNDDVRDWFRSHVVRTCELWVADDDLGRLVAILVLDDDWVDQLYVDPKKTGHGIGSRLLAVAKR